MLTAADLARIERKLVGVQSLASGLEGEWIATGTSGRLLSVFNHDVLAWTRDLRSHDDRIRPTERIRALTFADEARKLVVAAGPRVYAFCTETGKEVWRYESTRYLGFLLTAPTDLQVAADGSLVLVFDCGRFAVLEPDGTERFVRSDNYAPRFLRLTGGPGHEAVGTDGQGLYLWEDEFRSRRRLGQFPERIQGFDVRGGRMAIRLLHTARVQDLSGEEIYRFDAALGLPVVSLSPQGWLASAEGGTLVVRDREGKVAERRSVTEEPLLSIVWVDERNLVVGSRDGSWSRICLD